MNTIDLQRLALAVFSVVGVLASSAGAVSEVQYRLAAQSGTQRTGLPDGVNFSGFSNPRINDEGQVVFRGFFSGTGVNTSNNQSLWSEGGGSLHLIAREGTAAPGTGAGVNFGEFSTVRI